MVKRVAAALTVAGSDSGGNAGIQADLRAFRVFGVHGCCAITALTAQNQFGVDGVECASGEMVAAQIASVLSVYGIGAIKVGMLANTEIVESVADALLPYGRIPLVVDPVMVATSGAQLLADEAVAALKSRLLPLAAVITPNLAEAELLVGRSIGSLEEMGEAASELSEEFNCAVVVKGGHSSESMAVDVLCDGSERVLYKTPRIEDPLSTHGTGCSLSAALAASLACGRGLVEAFAEAKAYVYQSIIDGVMVGEVAAVLGIPENIPVESVEVSRE